MLLNMAIMKCTKKILRKTKTERNVELAIPDLIGFNCKNSSEIEEKFFEKKVRNLTKVLSQDIGGFIKKIEKKLDELYGMVSTFDIDNYSHIRPVSYKSMVGDEVRCKLQEWKGVVANLKSELKMWRTLDIQDKLLLIQLELDLDECKVLISAFVNKFEIIKSSLKYKFNDPKFLRHPQINTSQGVEETLINLST